MDVGGDDHPPPRHLVADELGLHVLAFRDAAHLRRDGAPAGMEHLGHGVPRETGAFLRHVVVSSAGVASLRWYGAPSESAPQIRFKESAPRAPSQPPRGAPPAKRRRQPMILSAPSHVAPRNRHRGPS